ncbi:hypothetical protein Cal7507_5434 [Calothrix sp. PCC 7507]|nr:hypothetical protein Cal7507_5434 [Calothrix sp. PCC 7507]
MGNGFLPITYYQQSVFSKSLLFQNQNSVLPIYRGSRYM